MNFGNLLCIFVISLSFELKNVQKCSGTMKPLAFCMHHNFTNIQQPPSSSRSKTTGKSHDFDIDFGINFCCTAVQVTEVISKQVLVCLFCKGKLF